MMKLAFAFNQDRGYRSGEFSGWHGRVLLVTSDDEPYHGDVPLLKAGLPGTEVFTLPSGFKHIAPQIFRDDFQDRVQNFIDGLPTPGVEQHGDPANE